MGKLKNVAHKLKQKWYIHFGDFKSSSILCLSILLSFLFLGDKPGYDFQTKIPMPLLILLMVSVGTFLLLLIFKGLRKLFPRLIQPEHIIIFLLIASALSSYTIVSSVSSKGFVDSKDEWILAILPVALTFLLSIIIGALRQHRRNIPLFVLSIVTFIMLGFYGSFMISEGYRKLPTDLNGGVAALPEKYKVEVLDYGPGEEIEFPSVNLMSQVSYAGFNKKVRDKILGYDMSNVPLRGRIYMPKDVKNAPMLVFAHGNHIMIKDSYLGYDALGKALASNGFIFVSVDHKMFNGFLGKGVGNENDGRAVLLLEQVRELIEASKTPGHPLEGAINAEEISVGGHSRGGEASVVAALFNQRALWADNANFDLDYDFKISGVLSVSPTAHQYMPADHEVKLKDVNYLLIHGSHDQDVNSFQGMELYSNISYTGEGDYFKSSVLVKGANHGQFNRMWGRHDKSFPYSLYLNTRDLLPVKDQEKILSTYVLSFLQAIYEGGPRSIFINPKLSPYLPKTEYFNQYQNSQTTLLADYEEDDDLTTASTEGITIDGENLSTWREGGFPFAIGGRSRNHVVTLSGGSESTYGLNLKESLNRGDLLTLDVAPNGLDGAPYVVLSGGGQEAKVKIKDCKTLLSPLEVGLLKIQHLRGNLEEKTYLQTVIIPVELFTQENPDLKLENIDRMELRFEQSGQYMIDNIGIITLTP